MPALNQKILGAARGLRTFLSLESSPTAIHAAEASEGGDGTGTEGIEPGNVIWIFGNARTGSTWLALMMEELEGHTVWREPYVGQLFGRLYYDWAGEKHSETRHFILGREKGWLKSARSFVLNEAGARFPEAANGGYLVVKEPNGSIGAPLMMEALPESRMILLARDPRDVVASSLDARRKGGWRHEKEKRQTDSSKVLADRDPLAFAEGRAKQYLRGMEKSKEAYNAHEGRKALVRYEDLVADTLGTMRRMYSELGVPVDDAELVRTVEKHSWENVPEEKKGEGKFHRKATPGGWREDLTPEQAETVERITASLMKELYPDELQSAKNEHNPSGV